MGNELVNNSESPTDLLLRSADDAAAKLLKLSREFSQEGLNAAQIVEETQKTGDKTMIGLVVDGTGSMIDDVEKVRKEVVKFLLTLFPQIGKIAPNLHKLYGGKFKVGAVCIEFGDTRVYNDYPFFRFTVIDPTIVGQDPEKHPIIEYLRTYDTSFDGGTQDKESGADALTLGCGFDPAEEKQDGTPTLGAQLVKAILQMVENEREKRAEKFKKWNHREPREGEIADSITGIYSEVLQHLPPQILILVTDELARTDNVTFEALGIALRKLQKRPDIIITVPANETVYDGGEEVNVMEWWKRQVRQLLPNSDGKAVPVLDLNTLGSNKSAASGVSVVNGDNLARELTVAALTGMGNKVKGLLTDS